MSESYQSEEDEDATSNITSEETGSGDHDSEEYQEDEDDNFDDSGDESVGSDVGSSLESETGKAWWQQLGPRTRRQPRVDYRENKREVQAQQIAPSREASTAGRRTAKNSVPVTHDSWKEQGAEEVRPHSSVIPIRNKSNDINHWAHRGILSQSQTPATFFPSRPLKEKRDMRAAGYGASRGPASNIVEEYLSPNDGYVEDFQGFKAVSDAEKQEIIAREAEDYGLERPKGWNVSFHYNPHVEYHHFGSSHPMKPWRLTLTKQLVLSYGLEYTMDLYEPRPANFNELAIFHDREYLSYLSKITPQNAQPDDPHYISYGFGGESNDCPVFDGLWNYVSLYSGASMSAAWNLLNKQSDIAINWSGGLHHAKKNLASGFCYVNDIVIAIQLLLTQHQRVLYIDIDVHHGDGVEQAFESTDRVFTLSYHKFGIDRHGYPFFPGTGNINEMGPSDPANRGKGHSLNIPIDDGIDDDQYKWLFKTVTSAVVEKYRPQAIVLQSGADSLGGDRLGRFNLNIKAHGSCIETVKSFNVPILLIGGGGYTPRNVARTWCHETAVCVGATLHNALPAHIPYIQAFQGAENGDGILYPDLHNTKRHENLNSMAKLQKLLEQALENLRYLEGAPSVVVNTKGVGEEEIMRVREMVECELEDEEVDRGVAAVEAGRRRRERNVGEGERGLR
ncbi:histone deacetylase [Neocucurbitaria cava]|uniref:histone deacetylase n=1 Tax=Neocucurbitaria cava TaxID=798079 RepID=A0A9W8XZF0_9PLEO|nr:histone deacetylase [Neocucurbitaria cava]